MQCNHNNGNFLQYILERKVEEMSYTHRWQLLWFNICFIGLVLSLIMMCNSSAIVVSFMEGECSSRYRSRCRWLRGIHAIAEVSPLWSHNVVFIRCKAFFYAHTEVAGVEKLSCLCRSLSVFLVLTLLSAHKTLIRNTGTRRKFVAPDTSAYVAHACLT